MLKYIHGSEDSTDVDVIYIMDKMPTFIESQSFCSDLNENRNIATINNGIIEHCFKGTIDELNNGILSTYSLHEQEFPLFIQRNVERDVLIKYIRGLRCILSHCSRTKYRSTVKFALKSYDLQDRINAIKSIDFRSLDDFGDKNSKTEIYKIFAFQLGQCLGLSDNVELYTKSSIGNTFPNLHPFLYRKNDVNIDELIVYIDSFIEILQDLSYTLDNNLSYFPKYNKYINLRNEEYVKETN